MGGQGHTPATLPLGKKTWYPLYRRLRAHQVWSEQVQKKFAPLGFDPWTIQPVVGCYTDYYDLIILFYLIITVLQAPLEIHKLMSTPMLLVLTLKKKKLKLSMQKLGVTNG